MMTTSVRGVVAVGVDGTAEAMYAAQWAVEAAHRRHLEVLVANAYELSMVSPELAPEVIGAILRAAERVVNEAESQLVVPPTMKVRTLVELASPVTMLLRLSATGALVVLGSHHFNLIDRLLSGPVASAVAAQALCPVVIVPGGKAPTRGDIRPVVVALDGETAATAPLDFAFAEAELRGCSVIALHAFAMRNARSDEGRRASLAEVLAGHEGSHPGVPVRTLFIPAEPEDAIIDSSLSAALVVVGRPHRARLGSWSRSVAKAVLDRTHCPLVVVPQRVPSGTHSPTDGPPSTTTS
jgi:nucleotide-binding universal stress UspA family protein